MKKKLAIVTTHPIQYYAPIFKLLAERDKICIKVFYTWSQAKENVYDPGFKIQRQWDVPLLDGYDYSFIKNTSKKPGSHHFFGIENPELISAIEVWKPDGILVIGWAFRSHLRCLRYFKDKVPIFFRGDSTLLNEKRNMKTLLRRCFLSWVYRHIDVAFFVGSNNKNYFLKHGIKEKQLIKAMHAVDNDRFSSINSIEIDYLNSLKRQLGIQEDDFIVLFAGKLEPIKNPFFIVDLAEHIADPKVMFLIVGNGKLEVQLKKKASMNSRIKFLDFQNQKMMPSVYRLGDVFIMPSLSETWGLAANEAMACGLPVLLSSKVGGAVDLVQNNGRIFNLDEVNRVAEFVVELKNNPAKLKACKRASIEHIRFFRFEMIASALEEALL